MNVCFFNSIFHNHIVLREGEKERERTLSKTLHVLFRCGLLTDCSLVGFFHNELCLWQEWEYDYEHVFW